MNYATIKNNEGVANLPMVNSMEKEFTILVMAIAMRANM